MRYQVWGTALRVESLKLFDHYVGANEIRRLKEFMRKSAQRRAA
ncbi:MAG: hypothetical protein ACRYGH_11430 [Janthinobacterium lividum]